MTTLSRNVKGAVGHHRPDDRQNESGVNHCRAGRLPWAVVVRYDQRRRDAGEATLRHFPLCDLDLCALRGCYGVLRGVTGCYVLLRVLWEYYGAECYMVLRSVAGVLRVMLWGEAHPPSLL